MNNVTLTSGTEKEPFLKYVYNWSMLGILLTIMLAMGCHVKPNQLWSNIKQPSNVAIGMFSQFVLLPLTAYVLRMITGLDGYYAVGLLITSCCPSGAVSNMFTYYADGDVSLSITMTILSTILAIGLMPANIWLYGRDLETSGLTIPYVRIATTLVYVTSPVAFGMLIRWRFPKCAPYITKIGNAMGILLIVATTIMGYFLFPNLFKAPILIYALIILLPLLGMLTGYIFSSILKRPTAVQRTITIESGAQNIATAITIITLSFDAQVQEYVLLFPWLYSYAMNLWCVSLCLAYRCYLKSCQKIPLQEQNEVSERLFPNRTPCLDHGAENQNICGFGICRLA